MTTYHISADGSDSNSGTESDPAASLAGLKDSLSDGDTVQIHGNVPVQGENDCPYLSVDDLTIEGVDGGHLDASDYGGNIESRPVIWIADCEGATVRNLEISHAPAESIKFEKVAVDASLPFDSIDDMKVGGHVVDCEIHHNGLPLMWGEGRGGVAERVESYANFGPEDSSLGSNVGGDADGIQFTSGPNDPESHRGGAVIECSVHHNSDDGLDLYRATGIVIRDSVAYANGYGLDGEKVGEAPGKGFKLGGGDEDFDSGGCLIYNSAAWMNGAAGIGFNGANLPNDIWNCTLFGNARTSDRDYEKDISLYTTGGPSGVQTDKSTIYNSVAEQGLNPFETDLSVDLITHNNFNVTGEVRTDFSEYGFQSKATDDAGEPEDWNTFLARGESGKAVDGGVALPTSTAADEYHGTSEAVASDAPDSLPAGAVSVLLSDESDTESEIDTPSETESITIEAKDGDGNIIETITVEMEADMQLTVLADTSE